jgi:hypothetical protein
MMISGQEFLSLGESVVILLLGWAHKHGEKGGSCRISFDDHELAMASTRVWVGRCAQVFMLAGWDSKIVVKATQAALITIHTAHKEKYAQRFYDRLRVGVEMAAEVRTRVQRQRCVHFETTLVQSLALCDPYDAMAGMDKAEYVSNCFTIRGSLRSWVEPVCPPCSPA